MPLGFVARIADCAGNNNAPASITGRMGKSNGETDGEEKTHTFASGAIPE